MFNIQVIDTFEKLLELEPIWNKLLPQSDIGNIFMSFDWISFWLRNFRKEKEMLILLIKENNEPIGIAPFLRTRMRWRGLLITAITFITNYYSGRVGLIIKENNDEVFNSILNHLNNAKYNFDILYLDFVVKNSLTYNTIKKYLLNSGLKYREMRSELSPYIQIEQNWEEFLKSRSKNLRNKIKRINNIFFREKNLEILRYSKNDIHRAMEEVLTISKKTWKYKNKSAIANKAESIIFFSSLLETAALKGWLEILILKFQDKPIAFMYNLSYKQHLFFLKIGYDESYRDLSPGFFLLSNSIKGAFDNNFKEYDLMGKK